jgi:hypothetical protein
MKKLIQGFQQLLDRKELSKSNKKRLTQIIINTKLKNEKK